MLSYILLNGKIYFSEIIYFLKTLPHDSGHIKVQLKHLKKGSLKGFEDERA